MKDQTDWKLIWAATWHAVDLEGTTKLPITSVIEMGLGLRAATLFEPPCTNAHVYAYIVDTLWAQF